MYSTEILEAIMNDTTRQRYALLKLFTDKPNRQLTRKEIMESTNNPFVDKEHYGKGPQAVGQ